MALEEVLFARTKCLPVLLYGTEVSDTNSAIIQSLQFTLNKVLFKLFGPHVERMLRRNRLLFW